MKSVTEIIEQRKAGISVTEDECKRITWYTKCILSEPFYGDDGEKKQLLEDIEHYFPAEHAEAVLYITAEIITNNNNKNRN